MFPGESILESDTAETCENSTCHIRTECPMECKECGKVICPVCYSENDGLCDECLDKEVEES